jgi:hypothetical protein
MKSVRIVTSKRNPWKTPLPLKNGRKSEILLDASNILSIGC